MKVCAIIAEYNPLHNGHVYHIQQTKNLINPDFIIVIMSGNFTQRGEPAIIDKWSRASWALEAGADMVIELPTCYSVSSANNFAKGAVDIIKALGVVTHLSFGSETDDLSILEKAVELRKNPNLDKLLFDYLKKGLTYAKAFEKATEDLCPQMDMSVFSKSNSILAMEYLHQLNGSNIQPVLIKRKASKYNSCTLLSPITSATSIRNAITQTKQDISKSIPSYVQIPFPVTMKNFDLSIRTSLHQLGTKGISNLQDVTEGLENRIYSNLQTSKTVQELLEKTKTKRYLFSRIQRIMIYSLLNIQKNIFSEGTYARLLAIKKDTGQLTSAIKSSSSIPFITKASEYKSLLNENQKEKFEKDIQATNIYSTVSPIIGNSDFTQKIIVK